MPNILVHLDPELEYGVTLEWGGGKFEHLSDLIIIMGAHSITQQHGAERDLTLLAGHLALCANTGHIGDEEFFGAAAALGFATYDFATDAAVQP
jgi:hypothetical protein